MTLYRGFRYIGVRYNGVLVYCFPIYSYQHDKCFMKDKYKIFIKKLTFHSAVLVTNSELFTEGNTVKPRYNVPRYNENPDITSKNQIPFLFTIYSLLRKPGYNETRYNENPDIT